MTYHHRSAHPTASTDPRSIEAEVGVCGSNAAPVVIAGETEQLLGMEAALEQREPRN